MASFAVSSNFARMAQNAGYAVRPHSNPRPSREFSVVVNSSGRNAQREFNALFRRFYEAHRMECGCCFFYAQREGA